MPEYRVMDDAGRYTIQQKKGKKTWVPVGEASDLKTAKLLLHELKEGRLEG